MLETKMLLKYLFAFTIISLFSAFSIAQNNIEDSLATKTFDELRKTFYYYKKSGQEDTGRKVALYTLKKARKEKNTRAIANSYIRLCKVSFNTPEIALKYTDSCIYYATNYKIKDLTAEGQFYRGLVLFDLGRYSESLDTYLKIYKFYENRNDNMFFNLRYNIALLKLKVRSYTEAIEILKENLEYENERENYGKTYLNTLYALSIAYTSKDMLDSAYVLNKEGYKKALKLNDGSHLDFTYSQGALHYTAEDYQSANDSLLKAIPYLKLTKDYPNLAIAYFYLGSISNDNTTKIRYYKKVDSIFRFKKYIIPAPRKAYEYLINYYKSKEDFKSQLHYTERLLVVDTVINREYRNVTYTFQHEYDTPRLVKEKEFLISELNRENEGFKYGVFILLLILLFVVSLLVLLYRKKKINEEKFHDIISSLKVKSEVTKTTLIEDNKRKLSIDEETLNQILDRLKKFEETKSFLTPKLTLNSFAKDIGTNSKYLSVVINSYKFQTFKNYVNNLRIEYIIEKLYNDKILRNYTIQAIAKEAGFSSTESFTRAFSKKTGLNVSYFLKKIK
ncbi:helix-turn-helix domain-containing protein [Kordia sp.]|uniref:helix-turn-helix domain-containing protein n=1 Tax=Kordia sp. TaxID=1965332 RepID=UPI003B5A1D71